MYKVDPPDKTPGMTHLQYPERLQILKVPTLGEIMIETYKYRITCTVITAPAGSHSTLVLMMPEKQEATYSNYIMHIPDSTSLGIASQNRVVSL